MIVLPAAFLLTCALFLYWTRRVPDWRLAVLWASLVSGLLVVLTTELLGAVRLLTFGPVAAVWALGTLCVASACAWASRRRRLHWEVHGTRALATLMIGVVSGIASVLALVALLAPPNTWDSMTYHMARVVHWQQNRTTAHYPTATLFQLTAPPWAEYAILQLQILSRGDRFANLVQYLSFLGSLIGTSLIARRLGAGVNGQAMTLLLVASIPMGILQASSTQNDYAVTCWLVSLTYFGLAFQDRQSWAHAFGLGASLGLACLTKGTAYIYGPALIVFLTPPTFDVRLAPKLGAWAKRLLVALLIVLLTNIGFYARNSELFGRPLVSLQGRGFEPVNEAFTASLFFSTAVRNVALHLGTPIHGIDVQTEAAIRRLHAWLGVGVQDPRSTWPGTRFRVPPFSTNEDRAGNPLHLLLVFASATLCLFRENLRSNGLLRYLAALGAAASLFALTLKWEPWHSRLHLPLFVLACPFIATVLTRTLNRKAMAGVGLVFVLASLPWLFVSRSRPILGGHSVLTTPRIRQYFRVRPDIHGPYEAWEAMASMIEASGCRSVGVFSNQDGWEYPLWVLLGRTDGRKLGEIEHVGVDNISARLVARSPFAQFSPCAVAALTPAGEQLTVSGQVWTKRWAKGRLSLFLPSTVPTADRAAATNPIP
jgi:hypothetical protein